MPTTAGDWTDSLAEDTCREPWTFRRTGLAPEVRPPMFATRNFVTRCKRRESWPDKQVLLYDANGRDRLAVGNYFRSQGIESIHFFDINEWANQPDLPLERYPDWERLVPATIVRAILDGERPETFEDAKKIQMVEASWGDESASYDKGHLPASIHINTDDVEPPPSWMLADREGLQRFAEKYGIERQSTVIVSSADPTAAYRIAFVLEYIGVQDVRILDGGDQAWVDAGYELETRRRALPGRLERNEERRGFLDAIPARPELVDTYDRLVPLLANRGQFTLVDIRTWDEHVGKVSGYSYHHRKGRIPGTVFGQVHSSDSPALDYYRNVDRTMRNGREILGMWKAAGIDTNKHMSFMCGSGWRAAEVFAYSRVLGLEQTSVYSNGWIEWSNNPDNPIETGVPER